MSIFKDTLSKYVQNQLAAREIIISQGSYDSTKLTNNVTPYGLNGRSSDFLGYVSGKNSWVRMQSFVDYNGEIGRRKGANKYSGSELARKYILEGGVLYEAEPGKFTLRSGVGKKSSVYASNIDLGGDRPLGLRPMPGITSVQVNNKSAYGSLREATIKFYAWDKHQLEELEILYMRTGYTVLLEWGWSQYLDSKNLGNIRLQNFDIPTIDIFYDNEILNPTGSETSDEVIYSKIEALNEKTSGNYDAMLGHIKNFSWQLLPNGGFECTTVLISRGEVISTLKVSNNSTALVLNDKIDPNVQTPPLSQFEQIFLNYSALVDNSELTAKWSDGTQIGQFATGSSPITSTTITNFQTDLNSKLGGSQKVPLLTDDNYTYFNSTMVTNLNEYYGLTLLTTGYNGVGIEYIKMDHFIALLNLYFNYKDKNNKVISKILIPKENLCLASSDSVSIDPGTCIVFNSKAENITLKKNGFIPNAYIKVESVGDKNINPTPPSSFYEFIHSTGRGKISNIYISIPRILEIYRSFSGDVSAIDLLKKLLEKNMNSFRRNK